MRKTALTLMIILLLLSCAGNNETKLLLSRAEDMLNEHPDSSYALLEGGRAQSADFSESDRMRYNLLLAYSMAKNGIPLDTFMSIRDIVDYYDTWGSSHDKMIANYMLGNVYKDKGDTPMALQYFRDAVGHADTTKTDCDFRTLSRIYGQMAVLFHSQRSPKLELEMERKAERYANIAKDSISAVIFYAHTADAYHLLGDEDSVLHIFTEAAKRYIELGHRDFAASTKSTLMEFYMKRGDYEKAKMAMDEYEQFSGFFNEKGEIERGREIYFYIKEGSRTFSGSRCSANYSHMVVLPDGQVTICEQLYWNPRFIIGNIKEQTIEEIWNSPKALALANIPQENLRKKSVCSSCELYNSCLEYPNKCYADVLKAYGDENWDYPDPRCSQAPAFLYDMD